MSRPTLTLAALSWPRPLAGLLLLTFTLAGGGCQREGSAQKGAKKKAERPPKPVELARVVRGEIGLTLRYPGELQAPESVELSAEAAGRLELVAVRLGDRVKRGQLLTRLDAAQVRAKLQQAKAQLQVARATLSKAAVEQKNAEAELRRTEPLAQKELVTRKQMDDVRARRDAAVASRAMAQAQVAQATAGLALLRRQLADTEVRAPFDGWIQARHLDPGAVVSAGTPVLRLVQRDPLVVRFKVGERHIGELQRRTGGETPLTVGIEVDAYPDQTFRGEVVRLAPALETASRTAPVEAELKNTDGRLMPGMFCRVTLDLGTRRKALLLPLRALLDGAEGGTTRLGETRTVQVFAVQGGQARRVELELGVEQSGPGPLGGVGEVLTGLEEGAMVVIQGQQSLEEGDRVVVVGQEGTAAAAEPGAAATTSAPAGKAR